jgi:formylglycine-generating enzyme required for sulfatase activity
VTVGRYKKFLHKVGRHGSAGWDHPDMPAGHAHQPPPGSLPVPGYYEDPAFDDHPAAGVSWWSAYAFARSEGKRLPSSGPSKSWSKRCGEPLAPPRFRPPYVRNHCYAAAHSGTS